MQRQVRHEECGHSFLPPMSLQCYLPPPLASLTLFSFSLSPLPLTLTVSQQHTINCFHHYSHQSYLSPFASSSTKIHSLAITVITLAWKPLFKSCQAQPNHAKSPQHNRSAPPIHAAGGSLLSPGRTHRCYMLCPFSYIYLSYLSRNHMFNIVLKALKCYHSALPVMRQLSDNQKIAFTLIFNLIIT